jgi:hypothetical protein
MNDICPSQYVRSSTVQYEKCINKEWGRKENYFLVGIKKYNVRFYGGLRKRGRI